MSLRCWPRISTLARGGRTPATTRRRRGRRWRSCWAASRAAWRWRSRRGWAQPRRSSICCRWAPRWCCPTIAIRASPGWRRPAPRRDGGAWLASPSRTPPAGSRPPRRPICCGWSRRRTRCWRPPPCLLYAPRGASRMPWWPSTAHWPRRSSSGRSSWAPISSCTRRPSTWAAIPICCSARRWPGRMRSQAGCGSVASWPAPRRARSRPTSRRAASVRSPCGWSARAPRPPGSPSSLAIIRAWRSCAIPAAGATRRTRRRAGSCAASVRSSPSTSTAAPSAPTRCAGHCGSSATPPAWAASNRPWNAARRSPVRPTFHPHSFGSASAASTSRICGPTSTRRSATPSTRPDPRTMTNPDWHTDAFPELRPGPPWVMQEMIAAQPAVVEALLNSPPPGTSAAAEAIAAALEQNRPVTVCGCGTSEHAAHAIAALLSAAVGPQQSALVQARPALSAALDPAPGACVAISHDGEPRASTLALVAAGGAGAHTIAIPHQRDGGVARAAEGVLVTPRHDDSWCHTVAYTSALAAGAALAGRLGPFAAEPSAARELLAHATGSTNAAPIADHLADRRVVLCAGADEDHTTARELALKIAEGARLPTLALELETVLHGQLAAHNPADALILVAITDRPDRERLARRAAHVARAAAAIGLPVAGLFSDAYDRTLAHELTPAGRVVIQRAEPNLVDRRLAGLLAGAGALQILTLGLAHARHTNPDLIRREEVPYRRAAQEAESSADW